MLAALGERLTNAEIAARLFVSERTVESHVSALLRKLEASSRLELARLARAHIERRQVRCPGRSSSFSTPAGTSDARPNENDFGSCGAAVLAGQMVVVVVSGEAGIGKSRLVAEFTAEVSGSARVLLGSCFEDSDAPYQPFVQAIETDIAGVSDSTLRRWVDADASSLGRIVPEIDRRCDRQCRSGRDRPARWAIRRGRGRRSVSHPLRFRRPRRLRARGRALGDGDDPGDGAVPGARCGRERRCSSSSRPGTRRRTSTRG